MNQYYHLAVHNDISVNNFSHRERPVQIVCAGAAFSTFLQP